MNYNIYLNIKKINKNAESAIQEYTKRLGAYCKTAWFCQPANNCSVILSKIKNSEHTRYIQIVTDTTSPSSEELADYFKQSAVQGISTVYIFIGYPFIDPSVPSDVSPEAGTELSIEPLSLSSMSLSTELSGIVFFEQLYRCYRIQNNQPYHK